MARKESILALINADDWDGLNHLFLHLSNSEFRKVEGVMKDFVLPDLPNDVFWKTYLHLLMYRKQSFLACILSLHHLAKRNQLDFECDEAKNLAEWLKSNSPESVVKVIRMAVPILANEEQILGLFRLFDFYDEAESVNILLKESTPYAYFALFKVLQRSVDNKDLLRSSCLAIMKKNDDMSFNMASILRAYFDINDIKSTFSLQIEPYELSYIEQSYDNFLHVLKGKRPTL